MLHGEQDMSNTPALSNSDSDSDSVREHLSYGPHGPHVSFRSLGLHLIKDRAP